jgi:hypothetical protein
MTREDLLELVAGWDDTLAVTPGPDSDAPEIAWGDTFFYYAPGGTVPAATQPFATIVTKDYPDDDTSRLDRPDVFRVNVQADRETTRSWTAGHPSDGTEDPGELDRLFVHPVYGSLGWLAVLNPGPRTTDTTRQLLREAYEAARARYQRRRSSS